MSSDWDQFRDDGADEVPLRSSHVSTTTIHRGFCTLVVTLTLYKYYHSSSRVFIGHQVDGVHMAYGTFPRFQYETVPLWMNAPKRWLTVAFVRPPLCGVAVPARGRARRIRGSSVASHPHVVARRMPRKCVCTNPNYPILKHCCHHLYKLRTLAIRRRPQRATLTRSIDRKRSDPSRTMG